MLGASGYKEFTITAGENSGNATFRIAYQRPWEKETFEMSAQEGFPSYLALDISV